MATKNTYEFAKLFFDEEEGIYKLHRARGTKTFTGEWENDIKALNDLAKEGWELVASYALPELAVDDEGKLKEQRNWSVEHILRRKSP